jgi:hypothetical protein
MILHGVRDFCGEAKAPDDGVARRTRFGAYLGSEDIGDQWK